MFSGSCQCENHESVCSGCLNHIKTFKEIKDIVDESGDRWLMHQFNNSSSDVWEYKKHIVKAVHQDRAKVDAMKKLSESEALIIFDFAMKFLPKKFREAQKDFFGKRGFDILHYFHK